MDGTQLDKIKRRLGIDLTDKTEDQLIDDLIEDATEHFNHLTETVGQASGYDYIIRNVVVKMYARKGSEGVKSETVDGYSVTYEDWDELFKPYMSILDRDFGHDGSLRQEGRMMFW